MIFHSEFQISPESDCPYLEGKKWRTHYFFASQLSSEELEIMLSRGWRKFGIYYFRPFCNMCEECIPIRIRIKDLRLSKSMRRVIRNCENIRVVFREPDFREEIYEIYKKHSRVRFGTVSGRSDFQHSFFTPSCPALQSEYFLNDRLVAVGFLDVSSISLSSVYFIYDTDYMDYRLGTFSVLKETEYAANQGLHYYYLGYYVKNSKKMAYKNSFHVNEKMVWQTGQWLHEADFEDCPI